MVCCDRFIFSGFAAHLFLAARPLACFLAARPLTSFSFVHTTLFSIIQISITPTNQRTLSGKTAGRAHGNESSHRREAQQKAQQNQKKKIKR